MNTQINEYRRTYTATEYESGNWKTLVEIDQNDSIVSYGDLKKDTNGLYIELPYGTYSDYSGSTVERANCTEFLNLYREFPEVWEIIGGYGTTGVCISYDLYESNEEIQYLINGLFDYPLINDESLSELEMQLDEESFDSWVKYDLANALTKTQIEYDESTLESKFWQVVRYAEIISLHQN